MTQPGERVGSVYVDVEPDLSRFESKLERDTLPAAQRLGKEIANRIGAPIAAKIRDEISDGLTSAAAAAEPAAQRAGNKIGDAIGKAVRRAIEARLATAIKVKIEADTSRADREIARLRARLAALGTTSVRLRLDTSAAMADIRRLQTEIRSLSGTASVTLRIRVVGDQALRAAETRINRISTLAAAGARLNVSVSGHTEINQLARDLRAIARLSPINIRIQTHGVMQAITDLHLIAAFARTLGTINPTITVTVNATLALLRLATILGLAVAVGSVNPTVTVNINISGLHPAQQGVNQIGQAATAAQGRMMGLVGAGVLLFALLVPAAAGAAAAIMAIATAAAAALGAFAVLGLALYGVIQAISAVTAAQEQSGQAASQMASRQNAVRAAADGVRNAERGLAGAQREARKAQEELTQAREEARRANEDLALSVRENALNQRQAQLDLKAAKEELDKVLADPTASKEQREQAKINYEQAVLQVDDLALKQKRLAEQETKARKDGIEGSDQVRAAQERVRATAEAVTVAQEQLAAAHRQAAQAATQAGTEGNSALQKMRKTLADLSPEARRFVTFIMGLRDELKALQRIAEAGFLPGLQRGIEAFLPVLPLVRQFVSRFAVALGQLAEAALTALAGPFWQNFFDFLGTTGLTVLIDFLEAIGYLIKGFASLMIAFGPLSEDFSGGLSNMAKSFADWAAEVGQTQGFRDFVEYTRQNGPVIAELLGKLVLALVKLGVAFAPLGVALAEGLVALFDAIAEARTGPLVAIISLLGVLAITFGAIAGVAGAVVLGITLVAAGLAYAYHRFEAFRNIVDEVSSRWMAFARVMLTFWTAVFNNVIKPMAAAWAEFAAVMGRAYVWLWEHALKPTGEAIGRAAVWLWRNVLEPAWRGAQEAISAAWKVIEPIWNAIVWWITKVLGPWYLWLYNEVVKPVFQAIQAVISVAWVAIQVIFGLLVGYLKIVGAAWRFLYDNGVKPAMDLIGTAVSSVWTAKLKPIFEAMADIIRVYVAPKFRAGVDLLIFWWQALRDGLKAPIKFVIETVLNNGLLAGYRWIAEKFDLPNKDLRIPMPQGFATGGFVSGPGSATSDSIMARLSNGEYVIPAHVVRSLGVDFFDWLIGRKRAGGKNQRPGDGSEGLAFSHGGIVQGFAEGGLVGWLKGAWNTLTDPVGELKKRAFGILDDIPGGKVGRETVAGFTKKVVIEGFLGKVSSLITNLFTSDGYHGPITSDVAGVRDFIARQAGKPYVWAAAGPHGYDCSGIVSAAWNLMHGRNPYSHTFSTHTQARFFPKVGVVGPLTAGWSHPGERGGGRVGHTAGNIAGLPFESGGSKGVVVGNRAVPFNSFARFGTFDSGGWLMPGMTYAFNGTGKPERILTDSQWDAMGRNGSSGSTYNVYPQRAEFTIQDLDALTRRRDALARVGRPA